MLMVALCALALSAVPALGAEAKSDKGTASPGTLKLVEFFIKTPTADLPPQHVADFVDVDPETLPKKLRRGFWAKREELLALKRVADGNKKPPIRRLGVEGQPPCADAMRDPAAVWIMTKAGYAEIYDNEVVRLMQDTKCTECELEVEFTLKRVAIPAAQPKGKEAKTGKAEAKPDAKPAPAEKDTLRYFLHERDPLMALVAGYRGGKKAFGTNFFGIGNPSCH